MSILNWIKYRPNKIGTLILQLLRARPAPRILRWGVNALEGLYCKNTQIWKGGGACIPPQLLWGRRPWLRVPGPGLFTFGLGLSKIGYSCVLDSFNWDLSRNTGYGYLYNCLMIMMIYHNARVWYFYIFIFYMIFRLTHWYIGQKTFLTISALMPKLNFDWSLFARKDSQLKTY